MDALPDYYTVWELLIFVWIEYVRELVWELVNYVGGIRNYCSRFHLVNFSIALG